MQLYWLWYALLQELTLRQKLTLLERFSDPEEIYNSKDLPEEIQPDKDLAEARKLLNICRRKDIGILPMGDRRYPAKLRNISDPPLVLYYKGVLPDFEDVPSIGVVGTRKASTYGLRTAKDISAQIAACGGIVVSGGAYGIDTYALEGALAAEGVTVAVLGCGVDVAYPRENRPLFQNIQQTGCLLSEYVPGSGPKPWNFPARNRIISGICNGVLVVEAPEKSGALITANDALEQGRDVYVVPGNIDVKTCSGSNALLREGACAVFSGWDTLRAYEGQYKTIRQRSITLAEENIPQPEQNHSDKKDIDIPVSKPYSVIEKTDIQLSEEEKRLVDCIGATPIPVDTVIEKVELPTATVLSMLTKLALRGVVIMHPGKLVSLKIT